jgi:DNA invertase Pin-like site-specific DNA recombinase
MSHSKQKRKFHWELLSEPGSGISAVGYVRHRPKYPGSLVSEISVEEQKPIIEEYAKGKGWKIVRWYEESPQEANNEERAQRPAMTQLLKDVGTDFQVVLCYDAGCWARHGIVACYLLDPLHEHRIWWATSDGRWDLNKVFQEMFGFCYLS